MEEYFQEINTHFIDIRAELKSTRSSWKMKVIVGIVFEYDGNYKKVETEIFIYSLHEKKQLNRF